MSAKRSQTDHAHTVRKLRGGDGEADTLIAGWEGGHSRWPPVRITLPFAAARCRTQE